MAPQKKPKKTKRSRQSKNLNPTVWQVSLLSAIIFPSVFFLLKKDSAPTITGFAPIAVVSDQESLNLATCESLTIETLDEPKACSLDEAIAEEESLQIISLSNENKRASLFDYNQLITYNNETEEVEYTSITISESDTPPSFETKPDPLNSRLEIGGNYTYVNLKPGSNAPFHGNLGGAQALYEYRPMNRFYGAASFVWKEGSTSSDSDATRSLLYFDVQEKLGYTFAPENMDWHMTLFTGFGYRYFGQTLKQSGTTDLDFGYNEFYFPVGILTAYDITSWFSAGLDFTWMPQVYSTVSIKPLKGARWELTNKLANFYAKVPLTFSLTKSKSFQVTLTPFYEYWQDGHSKAKLSSGIPLGLPDNTYNFYGADVNFAYSF